MQLARPRRRPDRRRAISTALASMADAVTCPATFTVLHSDRVGALRLSAGRYRITLRPSVPPQCRSARSPASCPTPPPPMTRMRKRGVSDRREL
jgi:hypothetical protein